MVFPWVLHRFSNKLIMFNPVWVSSSPVGSSAMIRDGSFARALTIATRCISPALSCFGL